MQMQEPQKIDRDATVKAVCLEHGSVRAFCREIGQKSTRQFYYVLQGAGRSGRSWGRSDSKVIYERLISEDLIVFEGQQMEGAQ
jgi:hypothetical protein